MESASGYRAAMASDQADRGLPGSLSHELSVALAELFRALADPNRTRIVHALIHDDMSTTGLAGLLDMGVPAVSQHLRLLRLMRIVKPRRRGRLVFYSLDDRHIELLISLSLTHLQEKRSSRSAVVAADREIGSSHSDEE